MDERSFLLDKRVIKCDCIKDGPQNPPGAPLRRGGVFRSGRGAKHAPIYPTLKAYGTSGPTIGAAAVCKLLAAPKKRRDVHRMYM